MKKKTRLLLIRHGESAANREEVFSGHYDIELEEKGKLQAKQTAAYLTNTYQIDKVYASDLKRAYETGKAVADLLGVEVITNPGLREIDGGKWEAVKFVDLPKLFPEDFKTWLEDIGNVRCTGGESTREVAERVYQTVLAIAKENKGQTVAIATHAMAIRALQSMIQMGGAEKMQQIPWVSNASVSELEYEDGVWKYIKIGYDGHLQELRTALPEDI